MSVVKRLPVWAALVLALSFLVAAPVAQATAPAPAAEHPTKLVGARGVAIAIPRAWGFEEFVSPCFAPTRPFYTIEQIVPVAFSCPAQPPGHRHQRRPAAVSSLTIDDDLAHPRPAPRPDGVDCGGSGRQHTCTRAWRIGGVQLTATVAGDSATARAGLRTLGASITRLPDDEVAVPSWTYLVHPTRNHTTPQRETYGTYAGKVEDAGLRAVQGTYSEYDRVTEPAQGHVVPTGSAVVVGERVEGPQVPVPPDPSAPSGMKLVGARTGAIAVPQDWKQVDQPVCGGTDDLDHAYVLTQPHPAVVPCPVQPGDPPVGSHVVLTRVGTDDPTDGDGVVTCDDAGVCRATYHLGGIRFDVTTAGADAQAQASAIGATVQPLTQGWTAVPLWPVERDGSRIGGVKYQRLVNAAGFYSIITGDPAQVRVVRPVQGTVLQTSTGVRLTQK